MFVTSLILYRYIIDISDIQAYVSGVLTKKNMFKEVQRPKVKMPLARSTGSNKVVSEKIVGRCSVKKVFLKTSQNSQENTCVRVSFLI